MRRPTAKFKQRAIKRNRKWFNELVPALLNPEPGIGRWGELKAARPGSMNWFPPCSTQNPAQAVMQQLSSETQINNGGSRRRLGNRFTLTPRVAVQQWVQVQEGQGQQNCLAAQCMKRHARALHKTGRGHQLRAPTN
jgi:hypothetical protein